MTARRALAVAVAATCLSFTGCGLCANDVVSDVRSPDGTFHAVVFRRNCGATTDFTFHVSVLLTNQSLSDGEGNIFMADSDRWLGPSMGINVAWQGTRSLLVRFPASARIYHEYKPMGVIRVGYEKLTP